MDWLKKLLEKHGAPAELISKLMEDIKDTNYIPKERFDEVNNQVKELKAQLSDRDKQLKDLGERAKGNEELQKQISDLQEQNKNATKDFEGKIAKMQFDYTLEGALQTANVKNTKALKALLNLENVKLDGENIIGLSDQIEALKKSDSYLFEQTIGGRTPQNNGGSADPDGLVNDLRGALAERFNN